MAPVGAFPRPNPPSEKSSIVEGKISWFGGPNDPTSGPLTASGASVKFPGIAIYNPATLGGYWLLSGPGQFLGIVKQSDLGPAPSTGRKIDYTYSLLPIVGYTEKNFPTNSTAKAVWLGRTPINASGNIEQALHDLGGGGMPEFEGKQLTFNQAANRETLSGDSLRALRSQGYLVFTGATSLSSPLFGFGPNVEGTPLGGPKNNYVQSISDFFKNFSLTRLLMIVGGGILLILGAYILISSSAPSISLKG